MIVAFLMYGFFALGLLLTAIHFLPLKWHRGMAKQTGMS